MTALMPATSPRLKARLAGAVYLLVIAAGFTALFIRSALIVRGDAAATAANIMASETLFRLAFVSDLAGVIGYAIVTVLLYDLLKPVNRLFSLLAAVFSLLGCAVLAATFLYSLVPLVLLGGAPYLAPFRPDQLQALAMAAMKLYALGYTIGMVFFGLYCCGLGYLIFRSDFLPRLVGLALAIAGVADLIDGFSYFLAPTLSAALSAYTSAPAFVGEAALCVWLLLVGVDEARWREQASASRDGSRADQLTGVLSTTELPSRA